jgi:hypothetical protein
MPSRDLKSVHQTVKQIMDRQEVKRPTRATVYAIDGKRIDVYVPGSPSVMKHIEVVGEIERIRVGDSVALRWEHDRPQAMVVAEAGTDPGDFRNSVPVDGVTIKWGDNGLELAQQSIGLGHLTFDPLLGGSEYSSQVFTSTAPQLKGDYVWRKGKVGGQEIIGGTATGQHLNIYANAAYDYTGNIIMWSAPHVLLGTAGVTPVDGFSIENDSDAILGLHSGASQQGRIQWGDSGSSIAGQLYYDHSANAFSWIAQSAVTIQFSTTEFVINQGQVDFDFRVETDSDAYAFFIRGSDSYVMFHGNTPAAAGAWLLEGVFHINKHMEHTELSADPAAPSAGIGNMYMRDDGDLYFQNDSDRFKLTIDSVPVVLSHYIDQNQRNRAVFQHGILYQADTGDIVNDSDSFTSNLGLSRILIVVNAGSDTAGNIILSGTSVDRDTGAEDTDATETITIAGITTDGTTTDSDGNTVWSFTNSYISTNWWVGDVVVSGDTDASVDLSDVDHYGIAYEQFNSDSDIVLEAIDITASANNGTAWLDAYLYYVNVDTDNTCDISAIASIELPASKVQVDQPHRLRRSLTQAVDGSSDGVWMELHFGPLATQYWEDVNTKIWAKRNLRK